MIDSFSKMTFLALQVILKKGRCTFTMVEKMWCDRVKLNVDCQSDDFGRSNISYLTRYIFLDSGEDISVAWSEKIKPDACVELPSSR